MHKCFAKFGITATNSATWTIGRRTIDVPFSTKALIMDALAEVWASLNQDEVCTRLEIPPFDGSIIRKEYARASVSHRRLLVQLIGNTVYTFSQAHKIGA